jgi:parallel beta-helix repeat protein
MLPDVNAAGTDGPFRTLPRAQQAVREAKHGGKLAEAARVVLRDGNYFLDAPLFFTPEDSGTPEETGPGGEIATPACPVHYTAFPGERPIISGGRQITGWHAETLRGLPVWAVTLPEVAAGEWAFHQLFVNGERRWRPRLPKEGLFTIAELIDARFEGSYRDTIMHGADRFHYAEGDLDPTWSHVQDIEITVLTLWVSLHAQVKSLDPATRVCVLDRNSQRRMADDNKPQGARYFVDNVFEAFATPGQWYLDRTAGTLYYAPLPGETMDGTEVIAPYHTELLSLAGDDLETAPVQCLQFSDLTFAHNEWWPTVEQADLRQSATLVPGAVMLSATRECSFTHCAFTHLGSYAVELTEACRDIEVHGCDFHDLGAGGVKIWHGCHRNTVADCEFSQGGQLFHAGVGIIVGKASGNILIHNHIHHFYYTGISVGWVWGYKESGGYGNIIEYNHIHDIGQGWLSDMGGIYTLGVSPGTRIRYNCIHDVCKHGYGGWGIYLDEGSGDILVENNLCYRTQTAGFHQHYGRNNIIRNNIFALGGEDQIARGRTESHRSFTIKHNIIYFREGELFSTGYAGGGWTPENALFAQNLYWDAAGRALSFSGETLAAWQARGEDLGSVQADPGFRDPEHGDFRLPEDSPAFDVGFKAFDLSAVGPRGE